MSVQNFSLLACHEVAEKLGGHVSNIFPSCIELGLGLSYDNSKVRYLVSFKILGIFKILF